VASVGEPERQIDHIAEFADSSVRVIQRPGSLVGVPGSYGVKRWLYDRFGNRGNAAYTFAGALLAIGLSGVCALALDEPLLFPSLGATALLFFETPMAEVASPRNTIVGHVVAIAAAAAALALFGLFDAGSAYEEGTSGARAGAVALSVALTGGVLRVLRAAHPPAGATTMIVSLGLLAEPGQMAAVAAGIVLIAAAGWGINRALGVPAPIWSARR
jgi:CBS domain-containing membrane protein